MARRAPVTIRLGERELSLRPLTIDQNERIETALKETPEPGIRQAREIVSIGLSRDHGEIDLPQLEATVEELSEAMKAVLRQGGFVPPEGAPGEATAAAAIAPTGAPFDVA